MAADDEPEAGQHASDVRQAIAERDAGRIGAELAGLDDGTDPFTAAVRATRMPMIITNPRQPDNPIVFANNAFVRLTGYTRDEVIGRNCRFLQGPESDPGAIARIRAAVARVEPIEIDIQNYSKGGARFWNRLLIAPVCDATGAVAYFFASQFDVTVEVEGLAARTRELAEAEDRLRTEAAERGQVEEAFRQAQKMEAVGQLTGGIAHDINNMLQAISASLELMRRRIDQGRVAEAIRFTEGARKTVDRAAALTNRLLAFARRQTLQSRPVALNVLIEGMADLIRRSVGPEVTVELRLEDGDLTAQCDPNQLESALLNLVINARDAMPGGGRLTIGSRAARLEAADVAGQGAAQTGEYREVFVADTGSGMDEATKALAFDPFFTTKPLGQGTGLGLSQIYGFVRQSNGIVRLDSTLGQGTTVRLYLPRSEPTVAAEALPPTAGTDESGHGEVVLLVEDEAVVRALAAEQLREIGYVVLEAEDGPAALRVLRSPARVDVLVTDVGLPGGLNGRQVAEAARERRPVLPVLFITGFAGSVLEEQLAPRMQVIGKPFALDSFAARVQSILGNDSE